MYFIHTQRTQTGEGILLKLLHLGRRQAQKIFAEKVNVL